MSPKKQKCGKEMMGLEKRGKKKNKRWDEKYSQRKLAKMDLKIKTP